MLSVSKPGFVARFWAEAILIWINKPASIVPSTRTRFLLDELYGAAGRGMVLDAVLPDQKNLVNVKNWKGLGGCIHKLFLINNFWRKGWDSNPRPAKHSRADLDQSEESHAVGSLPDKF